MSGGNRGKGAALVDWFFPLVGILIAIGIAGGVGFLSGKETEQGRYASYAYHENAKESAVRECTGTEPARMFECVAEKYETSDQAKRADQDLTAQQYAAWAGVFGSIWSFLALIATALGLIWIKGTLDATRKAVDEASKATQATQKSADAAVAQYQAGFKPALVVSCRGEFVSMRQIAEARRYHTGPRATLGVESALWVANHGNGLAIIRNFAVTVVSEAQLGDLGIRLGMNRGQDIRTPLPVDTEIFLSCGNRSIGEHRQMPLANQILNAMTATFRADRSIDLWGVPIIIGRLIYEDMIGITREHWFAFKASRLCDVPERWGGNAFNFERKITNG